MPVERIVVVMPAYNEAEGLPDFLGEILRGISSLAASIEVVVVDDRSTDNTAAVVAAIGDPRVSVRSQDVNRGHGPTALLAYREALARNPSVVVHVDGDGQFLGDDFPSLVRALSEDGAEVVHGVRRDRTDPWFRRALSAALRIASVPLSGRSIPDPNTPLRAYRPEVLSVLIEALPASTLVPHVHLSLAEARARLAVHHIRVRSIPRRGSSEVGTMWGGRSRRQHLPSTRLLRFVVSAVGELWSVSLAPTAPMRATANRLRAARR